LTEAKQDQDIDLHIGRRLRARRRTLGLSQPQLAESVGVKFQQIQKYECGEDRISASRLWRLCKALETPVDYFYEDLAPAHRSSFPACDTADEPDTQREALDLARSFERLGMEPRKILLEMAKSLNRH
jgi:transcriptional regulator with XRE-family HTH domain